MMSFQPIAGAIGLCSLVVGCSAPSPPPAKIVVVLVDRSGSTATDRELYERACWRLLESLKPGDRLVAGWITQSSAADFRAYVDVALPAPLPPMTLLDVPSQYKKKQRRWEKELDDRRRELVQRMEQFLSRESTAGATKIFESLSVAEEILASEPRRKKLLVLLCDMVEESEIADFKRFPLDEAAVSAEIDRQRKLGILPRLSGVTVLVAGAHARSLERAARIEQFWRRYFGAAGAVIPPGGYSRTIPAFPE